MSVPEMGATAADVESGARSDVAVTSTTKSPPSVLPVVAAGALLLATSAAGAALLAWWAVQFHPDDEQTWMVPVGLVMFGTPIVAWFSVFASDFPWRSKSRRGMAKHDASEHGSVIVTSKASMTAIITAAGVAADGASNTDEKNGR